MFAVVLLFDLFRLDRLSDISMVNQCKTLFNKYNFDDMSGCGAGHKEETGSISSAQSTLSSTHLPFTATTSVAK